jgi:hypothetical protein
MTNQIAALAQIRDDVFAEVIAADYPGWKIGDPLPDDPALIAEAQALAGEHMKMAIEQMVSYLPKGPGLRLVVSR